MILNDEQLQHALELARAAFPVFTRWEHVNEIDEEHSGFTVWGEYVPDPSEHMPRRFYVTLDTYKDMWRGHLTIGQYVYMWSSADFGDAHLLETQRCASIEDAIAALKEEITRFFRAICPA
jgi:hypothetical protein